MMTNFRDNANPFLLRVSLCPRRVSLTAQQPSGDIASLSGTQLTANQARREFAPAHTARSAAQG